LFHINQRIYYIGSHRLDTITIAQQQFETARVRARCICDATVFGNGDKSCFASKVKDESSLLQGADGDRTQLLAVE
jgi:hypothetical protein